MSRSVREEPADAALTDESAVANESRNDAFEGVLQRRLSRRALLTGALAAAPFLVIDPSLRRARAAAADPGGRGLRFEPIALSTEDRVIVPPGYSAQVLIRWGDPLHPGVPAFDVDTQTGGKQARQFGYNCDFIGYFPLPRHGSNDPNHGLLAVNHEFTDQKLMFPGFAANTTPTAAQVDVELAAHGMSIVEVERQAEGRWTYRAGSRFNRRITGETEMKITGPAAGGALMKVSYDPTGTRVRGTLNNCAGGRTPWGTVLTGEENINNYFGNNRALATTDARKAAIHTRYGVRPGASERRWELADPRFARFDVVKEPNEPFRFGWVVEIDPYDPDSVPRKRTALGRMKHEGATVAVAKDGRVAVYSGDDQRFEYVYKFVSAGRFDPNDGQANADLLDQGTLHVAKFKDDGTGEWLPLVFGQGPLVPANGFTSQAEVLINARGAADAAGATKMDRPEDVETNPVTGKVYCVMTKNQERGAAGKPGADKANPRPKNEFGHIIELTEKGGDPAATTFTWEIFMLCGDPARPPEGGVFFAGFDPSRVSPIATPDNVTFDREGNMWIATDGQPDTFEKNDGIHAVPVEGAERGFSRQFLSAPPGAEVCGPEFTPDDTTLFCSIQHPGREAQSFWPDSRAPGGPPAVPRPSVVAIVKTARQGPQRIGS